MGLNLTIQEGRIGNDIEKKEFGEHVVYRFSIANDSMIKGERVTQWHNCQAWNNTGEFIEKWFKKGDGIIVRGEIRYESWGDEGDKKYMTRINVDKAYFTSGKSEKSSDKKSSASEQW